jgi:hypothetical protein
MDNRVKLIALAVFGLFVVVALATVGQQILETNNAGFYQIKQAAVTGQMTVMGDPGTYLQNVREHHDLSDF